MEGEWSGEGCEGSELKAVKKKQLAEEGILEEMFQLPNIAETEDKEVQDKDYKLLMKCAK